MWITSKFNSKCTECKEEILEGDEILYLPDTRKAYCKACGEELEPKEEKQSIRDLSLKARESLRKRR